MKLGFAVALTPFFLPFLLGTSKGEIPLDIVFILHMIKEAAIGGILGFLTSIPFYAAQGAGSLIDHQSGSQSLQVTDPSTQVQSSPTGLLYNNVMLVTFFLLGGPFLLFDALITTYSVFPTDQFINPAYFSPTSPLFLHVLKMLNQMMIVVLQLSAPSIIAVLMSDLFLGIANRMAPQVQISFLLWSLKSFSGIAVLWAGWWFIIKQIDIQTINWIEMVHNIFRQMKGL